MFILIERQTLILKNGGKWTFSYETKASVLLSQWEEQVYGTQSGKERWLLCELVFIPIDRRTSILKLVER